MKQTIMNVCKAAVNSALDTVFAYLLFNECKLL